MPCYHPLDAYYSAVVNPETRRRGITFNVREAFHDLKQFAVPCGRCIGCRLERSRQWAVRLMHEQQMHESASFLTLTYRDEDLPTERSFCDLRTREVRSSLCLEDAQKFMKDLRAWRRYRKLSRVRYFLAGEYGEKKERPHFHLILFGEDFLSDRVRVEDSPSGGPQFESPTLDSIWKKGRATISEVTFDSAAYVARYCVKKITGPMASGHYLGRKPEFSTMSRNPGIGYDWFAKFGSDVFPSDEVIVRGHSCKPPRFYDKFLERNSASEYAKLKRERCRGLDPLSDEQWLESSSTRQMAKQAFKEAQLKMCKRSI